MPAEDLGGGLFFLFMTCAAIYMAVGSSRTYERTHSGVDYNLTVFTGLLAAITGVVTIYCFVRYFFL